MLLLFIIVYENSVCWRSARSVMRLHCYILLDIWNTKTCFIQYYIPLGVSESPCFFRVCPLETCQACECNGGWGSWFNMFLDLVQALVLIMGYSGVVGFYHELIRTPIHQLVKIKNLLRMVENSTVFLGSSWDFCRISLDPQCFYPFFLAPKHSPTTTWFTPGSLGLGFPKARKRFMWRGSSTDISKLA